MCNAVIEIINRISSNEKFKQLITEKIGESIDTSELQKQKLDYEKGLRSVSRTIESLGYQLDNLDVEDELYAVQYEDLSNRRLNSMKRLVELQRNIESVEQQISTIRENQLTKDAIYTLLLNFESLFNKFDAEEKKKCLHEMIDSIELRKDLGSGKQGRIDYSTVITAVKFKFPININGDELTNIYLTNENRIETVVLLSKGEIDSKKVRVEFSLEDMDMSGFQKGATYEQIKAYVLKHTGLKVSSLYISQVKRKCGLDVGQNYNLSKKENAKVPKCPPEKEAAIMEALKYFRMI